jgi:tripartite-type tricarboxylate transporter receptor subunit TctC
MSNWQSRRGPLDDRGRALLRRGALSIAAVAGTVLSAFSPNTARAADFYAGKTISILVASDAGGGYDVYGRLLARHIARFIPGAPTIIVQNEPGAGGIRAAQQIFVTAPKDGTRIGLLRGSTMLDAILGVRASDFQPDKYEWVGNMAGDTDVCAFWETSGVRSFNDLLQKETLVGASGVGSQAYIFPNVINRVLGTKMKIISGYQGTGDRILAAERGELQGNCGLNGSTAISVYGGQIASGKLIPIFQSGLKPFPDFANVPMTQSFAKTDEQKRILQTVSSQMEISRVFAAPPGIPKDRIDILRAAFDQAVKDPLLIEDAKTQKLFLNPSTGDDVAKIISDMVALPEQSKKEAKDALGG